MAEYSIKARPTLYKGIQMRSRLEASFAQWLDNCGETWQWQYEPVCFADSKGQYLPDFGCSYGGRMTIFYEVKPTLDLAEGALERMHVIRSSNPMAVLKVVIPKNDGWLEVAKCGWHDGCSFKSCSRYLPSFPRLKPSRVNSVYMYCPQCQGEYLHLEEVESTRAGTDGIRLGAVLRFSCETCFYDTIMEITNRKGFTLLEVGLRDAKVSEFPENLDMARAGFRSW